MNKYKKYTYMLGLAIAALTAACDDPDEEITNITLRFLRTTV